MARAYRTPLIALLTAILLTLPVTAQPLTSAPIMQGANSGEQPDDVNSTFYLFGRETGTPCWGHYNNTDEDTSRLGYGEEEKTSGQLSIDWTCRMDPVLDHNIALEEGQTIRIHVIIDLEGEWENGQGNCQNNDCENLNISLMRGGKTAITQEFNGLSGGENTIDWDIPVTEDLVPWNKSEDSPAIRFTWIGATQSGFFGFGGSNVKFRLYHTHPCHSDETPPAEAECDSETEKPASYNGTMLMPVLAAEAAEEILSNEPLVEETPGFGALAGISTLMAAAWFGRRPKSEESDEEEV